MKSFLLFFLLGINSLTFAQETAGIYKFRWFVDKRLTNELIVNNTAGGIGGNNGLVIPPQLYDSVMGQVQKIVTEKLRVDSRFLYSVNKRGKERKTSFTIDHVGGLPRGTKRNALRTEYLEYYVKFKIHVGLTKTFGFGSELVRYSRLKPYVRVKMKAYGFDRRVKYRQKTRLSDFKSLNSVDVNMGGMTVTNTSAIPIEEVMDMVFKGLEKFRNKVK